MDSGWRRLDDSTPTNKEDRWKRDMLLDIFGNPWSCGTSQNHPDAGPTTTKPRIEENGRRPYITKRMGLSSERHRAAKSAWRSDNRTQECRARRTSRMDNGPAYAKRLEEILASRVEFAKPELEAGTPSDSRNNTTKRAGHEAVWPPQSAVNGGSSSSTLGDDVEMRSTSSGKRSLEQGGSDDDMVCGLEVCDELDECNAYRNDCEGDYTDKMTGATLLREDQGTS